MEFGENPFWALGWIVTGVRATIPQLLAKYFPAACVCFTFRSEPQNWSQFSRPPALPPCIKACTLTPHPFIYAPFGVLTGRLPT
jgi:hypothetical protein